PIKSTIYAPDKMTAEEAYGAFLSILEQNGLTVIPQGRFYKIVETQNAASQPMPFAGPATPVPAEDRYVTRLYRLANVDPGEAATLLNRLKSKDGDVSVYPPGRLLIVTDTGANIQRMLRILEEVDVGGAGLKLWVEPIHYASAPELAAKLGEIFGAQGSTGPA